MGAEYSRIVSTHDKHVQQDDTPSAMSWKYLSFGFQYTSTDVAVWPQCVSFLQWFTAQDALILLQRLQRRTRTHFLTFEEFRHWMSNDTNASAIHPTELPVYKDIMTPPMMLQNGRQGPQSSSLLVLDLALEHLFRTFAHERKKMYAMEFLAAMIVGSRAIWDIDEKVRILLLLFHDTASIEEGRFTDANLAQLFLCVMNGMSKLTVGIKQVWKHHHVEPTDLARTLALDCLKVIQTMRTTTESTTKVTLKEVHMYLSIRPGLVRFLAMFSGEEVRNPFTFGLLRSPCNGLLISQCYRHQVEDQAQLYQQQLRQYVTFQGRETKRRESAATLIQSTWRRRSSRRALERKRKAVEIKRHASAVTLQHFLRQYQFAKVLEQHAEIEMDALNGALFTAGQGPCIPDVSVNSTSGALRLVNCFKLLSVKIISIALSKTCALALQSDRQTIYAWGRCLPRIYFESFGTTSSIVQDTTELTKAVTLTQSHPGRLAYHFPCTASIKQLACGLSHALVLTENGNVYSWGFNDHGQLGHGSATTLSARTNGTKMYALYYDERDGREYPYLAEPTKLVYFQGSITQQAEPIPIQSIVCGDYYNMALSCKGDVFTWGEGSEGQLGHSETHVRFQVALVDTHMLNSAYTFLPEPEPVLALSDQMIIQIACRKNHSVALTAQGQIYEWGNWGKRYGQDREHAFTPIAMNSKVQALRIRQLSVGDHHMIGEGSSAWMCLEGRVDGLRCPRSLYLACSPGWCANLDQMESIFQEKDWKCVVIDCDIDDYGDMQSIETTSLWLKRVASYRLTTSSQIIRFDTKYATLLQCFPSLESPFVYSTMLSLWLHGHCTNRIVVFPRGKPSGCYLQFLIPHSNEMIEFPVVISNASGIGQCGFATHLYHSIMRDRLIPLSLKQKKHMTLEWMEENSIYVLELNEQSFETVEEEHLFQTTLLPDGTSTTTWSRLILNEILRLILTAQESGALGVLVILDLFDVDPFELQLEQDTGIYIPIFMLKPSTWASTCQRYSFHDVLEMFIQEQALEEEAVTDGNQVPDVPAPWLVRCMERIDTVPARIQAALEYGAMGVLIIQDDQSLEMDGETRGSPTLLTPPVSIPSTNALIAMISSADGQYLRAASHLPSITLTRPLPSPPLLVDVKIQIRPGGTVYAWGNGQNGRLGLGNLTQSPFRDGYEALTDTTYRFVDRPIPIMPLSGHEMLQLVSGQAHNIAITTSGRVFTWGKGNRGELAYDQVNVHKMNGTPSLRHLKDQWIPRMVHPLRYERIIYAAANDACSAFVSELVPSSLHMERRKEIAHLKAIERKSLLP